MLSTSLLKIIDGRTETIVESVIAQIRRDGNLKHLRKLPDGDLQQWARQVLSDLGNWLVAEKDVALGRLYEGRERLRFKQFVPLHEVVHALNVLKRTTIDLIREEGLPESSVEIFAEQQVEHLLSEFFDWLEEHVVTGYEKAIRRAAHVTP